MKKVMVICLLCALLVAMLMGWSWAQGNEKGEKTTEKAEGVEQEVPEPTKPHVTWGDYRYVFDNVVPSTDLDPQSVIMDCCSPLTSEAGWQGANYVHLYITVQWMTNDRPLDYMPLQLVLHSGGRSYILFGKGSASGSYLWRRGNHYLNDTGAHYPDYMGGEAKLFFTFDTNGAAIDPSTSYIEVNGLLEVWDWSEASRLYTYHENIYGYVTPLPWHRHGSSRFTSTHLADISLSQILQ